MPTSSCRPCGDGEATGEARQLDVVTVGRSSVDLYGEQVGGRLEDMASFAKYVGGCPTNIAVGTARLGLRSALITRVGDEHMGRFIKEQCAREGVDVSGVVTDPQRLTALVILGIRDKDTFPLIFYRENCADAALSEGDIDEDLIARAKAVVVTGTHFSSASLNAASRKAMRLAKAHGGKVVLDIDYRPVLWGLTGHGLGEERFVASDEVTAHLQRILPECDLVVGTEEEIHIAGGSTDTMAAIRAVRAAAPGALIVVKRGPMGCTAFPGAIPATHRRGRLGPGLPGRGVQRAGGRRRLHERLSARLAARPAAHRMLPARQCLRRLRGLAPWLRAGDPVLGRARGLPRAAAASIAGCARTRGWSRSTGPPTATANGRRCWPSPSTTAPSSRRCAQRVGASPERIPHFKRLALSAAMMTADGRSDGGILLDGRFGQEALDQATGKGLWIGRPVELPGSRPLRFEGGPDLGCSLREWPAEHCVKCLVFYHPDDPAELCAEQERQVLILADACRRTGHDLLLEVIPGKSAGAGRRAHARPRDGPLLRARGLSRTGGSCRTPAATPPGRAIAGRDRGHDPHCRGVLLLGLDAPEAELVAAFAMARRHPVCKGFAVGRTIFGPPAEDWLAGRINDQQAIQADGRRLPPADRRLGGRGMSELLLRHHAPDAGGLVHHVTPASAGWTYVGFELWRLQPGQTRGPGDRRARGLPGDRRRQGGHRGGRPGPGRAWASAPARSRAPARARSTCPGTQAFAGHRHQRSRARDLLGARRRQPSRSG